MVGPGEGAIGGILSLVETLVPELQKRINLVYLSTVKGRPSNVGGIFSLRNILTAISQYWRFVVALIRHNPNIIHIHTSHKIGWIKDSFFVFAGKIANKKIIVHVHAASMALLYKEGRPILRWYTRKVFQLADIVIAVSSEWAGCLATIGTIKKIETFRNCINASKLSPSNSPRPTSDTAKGLFLGSVGHRKGTFDLIEAVGMIKSNGVRLKTWIAGYEERKGYLDQARELIRKLEIENDCELLGMVIGEKKEKLLQEADMFILPSYNEGLPIAVLEALSVGLPIISTPVGGIPEVVKDGYNGFLIQPGDIKALADKLALLSNDGALRNAMGQRSREIAVNDLDVMPYVNRLVELYKTLGQRVH